MAWWKRDDGSPEEEPPADEPSLGEASASATGVPTRALFEEWVEAQDPRLARYRDFLAPTEIRTDFTRDSLSDLGAYLLVRYPEGTQPLAANDTDFLDGAVRYIGETLLRHVGGRWDYTDEPNHLFRGRPFLFLDLPDPMPIAPLYLITALVKRRDKDLLVFVFDNQVHQKRVAGPEDPQLPAPGQGSGSDMRAHKPEPSVWAASVPERLEAWRAAVAADFSADLTPGSLPAFTELVARRITSLASLEDPQNATFVDGAVTYLGEVMRRAAGGGMWMHGAGEPDPAGMNPYSGLPYLVREVGDKTIQGLPYWGLHFLVAGRPELGPQKAFDNYV